MNRVRVGISGSYGGLNLGDEAILQCMLAQLRKLAPMEITVFSRNAEDTLRRHRVERALAVRQLGRDEVVPEVARLDLLIIGGGGILFDADAKLYLREAVIAQEVGVPVMIYAVGAGPLHDPAAQELVRKVLNGAAAITVRDREAHRVLEELGIEREIVVTADPALLLGPEPLPAGTLAHEGLAGRKRLVGLSVREPGPAAPDIDQGQYHALLANTADFIVDRYGAEVVFVPMERQVRDVQHSHAVISQMLRPQRASVLKGKYSPGQLLELIGRFEFAVGMRLHFLMFAALREVPFVALPYAGKVRGFLEALGIDTPPMELVNSGRLIAHIDQSWDRRRSLRTRVKKLLPALQELARGTSRIAAQLLTAGGARATAR